VLAGVCALGHPAFATAAPAPPAEPSGAPEAAPSLGPQPIVGVFPLVNLSGTAVPLEDIRTSIDFLLRTRGLRTLPFQTLDEFMARHRMRDTSGLPNELGAAMGEETGATAALVGSVDLYDDSLPPKLALTVRFVTTDGRSRIIWMQGVALAGDEHPGWFDLGMISHMEDLTAKLMRELGDELDDYLALAGSGRWSARAYEKLSSHKGRRFRPKTRHRLPVPPVEFDRPLRVAAIPFANDSGRRNAGQIVMLQFVTHLAGLPGIEVVDPGVVRETLLRSRLIMERGGLSFPQAELLRALLDVDVVFTGTVMTYDDLVGFGGYPQVDFTMRAIDTRDRQVVFTSISYNRGDDGVYFFDAARYYTSHAMASEMVRRALSGLLWDGSTLRR